MSENMSKIDKIRQLKQLKDEKIITEEEFIQQKNKILIEVVNTDSNKNSQTLKNKKFIMNIIILVVIVLFVMVGVMYKLTGFDFSNNNMKVVATFDGGKITSSDFTIYYKVFAPMLENYGYAADSIPNQVANKAATDNIILSKAKAEGLTLSDEDKAKVDELFKEQSTIKQFNDKGLELSKIKQLYYNDYIITAYSNKVKTNLTKEEMTTYLNTTYGDSLDMNEYVTRHILFKTDDSDTEEQKAVVKTKAEDALKRVLAGEDFAKLASELSEDTGTKSNGGEYKMYSDEKTVEQYLTAVKTLEVGEITTSLVKTDYGYHIIKLESINAGGRVNSDSDREALASKKIDELGTSMNVKVNEENLNELLLEISAQ